MKPQAAPTPLRPRPALVDASAHAAQRQASLDRSHGGRVRLLLATDALALTVSGVATFAAAEALAAPAVIAPPWALALLAPIALLAWLTLFSIYGLYERQTRTISTGGFDEVVQLFNALLCGSLVLLVSAQVLKRTTGFIVYSAVEASIFLACAIVLVPLMRWATRTWLLPRVLMPRRTLIVGAGDVGQMVARKIASHEEYGLKVVGFVDDDARGEQIVLGRIADLTRLVDEYDVDRVVLAGAHASYDETLERVRAVRRPDVHLSIVPSYFEVFASNATLEDLEGIPLVSLPPMRLSRMSRFLKRSMDVVLSAAGLIVLSPVLLVVAIAIKLDSSGPVFFRQLRNGRGSLPFRIVKFRTMVHDAEKRRFELAGQNELDGPLFKMRDDPRITRIGDYLRRWSVDELPQLWNVLRGEMSLVGPRPFVTHEDEQIAGWAARRLETTPGITGVWQVLGRNDMPFDEMVKLDYVYVTNWSLWWDFKILFQTLPAVFAKRGAY